MAPVTPPAGGKDASAGLAAQQFASTIGAREIANVLAYSNAWNAVGKSSSGVALALGRVSIVAGALIPVVKSLYDLHQKHNKLLYESMRSLSGFGKSLQMYSQDVKNLSNSLGTGWTKAIEFDKVLKSSYMTFNMSREEINKLAKAIGTEFPKEIDKGVQAYVRLRETLPTINKLLEKQAITEADLLDVINKGGMQGVEDFLRIWTRLTGQVDKSTDKLAGWSRLQEKINSLKEKFYAPRGRGTALEQLELEMRKQEDIIRINKGGSDLLQKTRVENAQITLATLDAIMNKEEMQSARKERDRLNEAEDALKHATLYLQTKAEAEFENQIQNQLMAIEDARARKMEATFKAYSDQAPIWMKQLSISEQIAENERKALNTLRESGKYTEDSLEIVTQRAKVEDAEAKVLEKQAWIRRQMWEKILQMNLGLKAGSYTMPMGLSERGTKGSGYSPFAPLERNAEGQWGSYNKEGKFEARPQTGPYEDFYRKVFGGTAEYRPWEKEVLEELRGIKDNQEDGKGLDEFLGGRPTYQTGTDYVPETGPATLHEGEMVIPRTEAEQMRNAMEGMSPAEKAAWWGAATKTTTGGTWKHPTKTAETGPGYGKTYSSAELSGIYKGSYGSPVNSRGYADPAGGYREQSPFTNVGWAHGGGLAAWKGTRSSMTGGRPQTAVEQNWAGQTVGSKIKLDTTTIDKLATRIGEELEKRGVSLAVT